MDNHQSNWPLSIRQTSVVNLYEDLIVVTADGNITLRVNISADFHDIPEKYHEIFLNVLTSKYSNMVSFSDNQFSSCKPANKRRWFQFWKKKNNN